MPAIAQNNRPIVGSGLPGIVFALLAGFLLGVPLDVRCPCPSISAIWQLSPQATKVEPVQTDPGERKDDPVRQDFHSRHHGTRQVDAREFPFALPTAQHA
jgi:hypothetical protein